MFYGVELLAYPSDSDTVQLHHDHRCSSQSRAFNTLAVQLADVVGRTY